MYRYVCRELSRVHFNGVIDNLKGKEGIFCSGVKRIAVITWLIILLTGCLLQRVDCRARSKIIGEKSLQDIGNQKE